MNFLPRISFIILLFLVLGASWEFLNQRIPFEKNPVWKLAYAIYPTIENKLNQWGVHRSRQNFLIGKMQDTSERAMADFKAYLLNNGFEEAVIAWRDPGQVFSLRRFDGRDHQFHIRVFNDGEVRIHRELSTEAHPLSHVTEANLASGADFFLPLIEKFIFPRHNNK